jgi:hypothetical protein
MNWAAVCAVASLLCPFAFLKADDSATAYAARAPIEQYRLASAAEEIALARTAAPASISDDATVLVLGVQGYDTAVKGKNGFVCVVERGWGAGFDEAEFWNPKIRAPICFNAAAAKSVLPIYLARTRWVLAGSSKSDLADRHKAEVDAHRFGGPDPGAMSFMMSKQGYLNDGAGHWHPHLMFFSPIDAATWGADLKGSPVFASRAKEDTFTTFFVYVPSWSDATPAATQTH